MVARQRVHPSGSGGQHLTKQLLWCVSAHYKINYSKYHTYTFICVRLYECFMFPIYPPLQHIGVAEQVKAFSKCFSKWIIQFYKAVSGTRRVSILWCLFVCMCAYVCMCICVYVHMCLCTYVCMCIYVYVHIYVSAYIKV